MGTLPFMELGLVERQDGTLVADDVPVTLWPVVGGNDAAGRYYDHQAEAPLGYAEAFETVNAKVTIKGRRYAVIEVSRNEFLPHVALLLRGGPGG